MNFLSDEDFIRSHMRIYHVYQPVMLVALLEKGGQASTIGIAKPILEQKS